MSASHSSPLRMPTTRWLLASGRGNIVAALVPNLSHSIFGDTVQALSVGLQAAGLELLLAATGFSAEREEEQLRALLGHLRLSLTRRLQEDKNR